MTPTVEIGEKVRDPHEIILIPGRSYDDGVSSPYTEQDIRLLASSDRKLLKDFVRASEEMLEGIGQTLGINHYVSAPHVVPELSKDAVINPELCLLLRNTQRLYLAFLPSTRYFDPEEPLKNSTLLVSENSLADTFDAIVLHGIRTPDLNTEKKRVVFRNDQGESVLFESRGEDLTLRYERRLLRDFFDVAQEGEGAKDRVTLEEVEERKLEERPEELNKSDVRAIVKVLEEVKEGGTVRMAVNEADPRIFNQQMLLDTLRQIKNEKGVKILVLVGPVVVIRDGRSGMYELFREGVINHLYVRDSAGAGPIYVTAEGENRFFYALSSPYSEALGLGPQDLIGTPPQDEVSWARKTIHDFERELEGGRFSSGEPIFLTREELVKLDRFAKSVGLAGFELLRVERLKLLLRESGIRKD